MLPHYDKPSRIMYLYYLQENGFNFDAYNGVQKVFGSLTVVIADNPASCAIGGFKESSSAYRPCRHCLGTAEEIKINVRY